MTEIKKVPAHQKKVRLHHKSGTAHEFEPIDAKEILKQPDTEYAREPSFWDGLKNAVEHVADVVEKAVEAVDSAHAVANVVIDTADAVQNQVEDALNLKKKK